MSINKITLPPADAFNFPYRGHKEAKQMYRELQIDKAAYKRLRGKLLSDQNFTCAYCLCDLHKRKVHIEHVVALKRGGTNHRSNLVASCAPCNKAKGNRELSKTEKRDLEIRLKKLKKKSVRSQRAYVEQKVSFESYVPEEVRNIINQEW